MIIVISKDNLVESFIKIVVKKQYGAAILD